ncbi:MAG: Ldh family oxidoreductase, partial [Candidatus Poribacteria bacterium]|nr:Ldh family oxidoreductase [Candidatus Poribacteria bacterium]
MPIIHTDTLRKVGCDLFEAAGCSPEDAHAVTDHLVESSLFGHDSHGAIRYSEYARALRDGTYQPRATPVIVRQNPCTAVVDAQGALGQIGGNFAMNLAMEKARQYGTSTVVL